tara:strand:- start:303 stop:689 length:387 start_codon:yes stop_codon:yes gene_type:complete
MRIIRTAGWEGEQSLPMPKVLPPQVRRSISRNIYDLLTGKYFEQIPLQGLFDILKAHDVYPIDEEGSNWSGMLLGGKECGDPQAADQRADFDLVWEVDGQRSPVKNAMLTLSWCVMPSGKYEITSYLG